MWGRGTWDCLDLIYSNGYQPRFPFDNADKFR